MSRRPRVQETRWSPGQATVHHAKPDLLSLAYSYERAQKDGEFDPANLPAFAPARKDRDAATPKVILVQDTPPESSIVHHAAARPPKRYGGISSVVQARGGMAKIDRPTAERAITHVRSNRRTREENPEESLSIHLDSGEVSL